MLVSTLVLLATAQSTIVLGAPSFLYHAVRSTNEYGSLSKRDSVESRQPQDIDLGAIQIRKNNNVKAAKAPTTTVTTTTTITAGTSHLSMITFHMQNDV